MGWDLDSSTACATGHGSNDARKSPSRPSAMCRGTGRSTEDTASEICNLRSGLLACERSVSRRRNSDSAWTHAYSCVERYCDDAGSFVLGCSHPPDAPTGLLKRFRTARRSPDNASSGNVRSIAMISARGWSALNPPDPSPRFASQSIRPSCDKSEYYVFQLGPANSAGQLARRRRQPLKTRGSEGFSQWQAGCELRRCLAGFGPH